MAAPRLRHTPAQWITEIVAGVAGSLSVLAVVLTLGLLCYAALGANVALVGLPAAFVTVIVGGAVYALLARSNMPAGGPSSATALTLAGLVAQLVLDPQFDPSSASGVAKLIALCAVTVMVSGVLQMALALVGAAQLARVVPRPVLAGFMNGAAILIAVAQVPSLLGLPLGAARNAELWTTATSMGPLLLGLGTAAAVWPLAKLWPRSPAVLMALVAGSATHAMLTLVWPSLHWGAVVGTLPSVQFWPLAMVPLLDEDSLALLRAQALPLTATALALALLGMLETTLNVQAIDQLNNQRTDLRREMLALGAANLACGAFGGLPIVLGRARAMAMIKTGGTGHRAPLIGALAMALLFAFGGPLTAILALPVLAGVMLVVAWGLVDTWSGTLLVRWWRGPRTRDIQFGLVVVGLVCVATLWLGMSAGVALGVLLSLLIFALRMQRSLLRSRYRGDQRPSRRIYPDPVEARLKALRSRITTFELDGALFFGSGERLLSEAETLDAHCRILILDLHRVGTVDESGAVAVQSLGQRLARHGAVLLVAGLNPRSRQALALQSFATAPECWPDVDRATEAAERLLLGDQELLAPACVPPIQSSLMQGLDATQAACVSALLQTRELAPEEVLFREGDAADRLFILSRGSISVLSAPESDGARQRYLSISPGMVLGEMSMLDGGQRSADAVADLGSTVHALSRADLDTLAHSNPLLVSLLYCNLARHLSQRLRSAGDAWHASAR